MAVGQRLSLKQSQTLALTPGLRQSIELMQLSAGDLQALVQRKLEENPFLEREERGAASDAQATPDSDYLGDSAIGPAWEGADWSESVAAAEPSLAGYLEQEIRLAFSDPAETALALALLQELDEAGYLPAALPPLPGRPDPALVERVIGRLQTLGTPGLFARSLQECLALQLAERQLLDPPFRVILDNLPLVARGDRRRLLSLTGLEEPALYRRLQLLRTLDPKPALGFSPPEVPAAVPDLLVTLDAGGRPQVRLNNEALPRIKVNLDQRRALKPGLRRSSDKAYVATRTAEASWLVRALVRRGQSLLALGQELANRQAAFFTRGFPALAPLTRRTLAEALQLSESSVSRLVANKFLACSQGVVPLSRFFSAALGEAAPVSAAAASARLASLVAAEPPGRPLSDQALAETLQAEGYALARRTVAKYRKLLKIPATAQRRRRTRMGAGTRPPG